MKRVAKTGGLGLALVALLALGQIPSMAAAPSLADCLGPDALVPDDERFCKRLLRDLNLLSSVLDLPELPEPSSWLPVEFERLDSPEFAVDAAPSVYDCLGPDALVPADQKYCQRLLRDMHIPYDY